MTDADWIALGALGLTGAGMFVALMRQIFVFGQTVESRFGELSERLTRIEIQFGITRNARQVDRSAFRLFRGTD